jgi:valyl-tRNA synthetase
VAVRCSPSLAQEFNSLGQFIQPLARVGTLQCGPYVSRPAQAATAVHADFEAYVNLQGLIDIDAETKRLTKQKADKERALQGIRSKLANESFTAKAPPEVVAQQRSHEAELVQQIEAIVLNLKQLGARP